MRKYWHTTTFSNIEYSSKNLIYKPKSSMNAYKYKKHSKGIKEQKFYYETWITDQGSKRLRIPSNLETAFQKRMKTTTDFKLKYKTSIAQTTDQINNNQLSSSKLMSKEYINYQSHSPKKLLE